MKQCSECGENKSEDSFYKKKSGRKAGYFSSPKCKDCLSDYYKVSYKNKVSSEFRQEPLLTYKQAKELYESIYA